MKTDLSHAIGLAMAAVLIMLAIVLAGCADDNKKGANPDAAPDAGAADGGDEDAGPDPCEESAGDSFPDGLKNGDWDFAIFKPSGERLNKDLNTCRSCHAPMAKTQHLFSLEHLAQ